MKCVVINSRKDYGCSGAADFPPVGAIGEIVSEIDAYQEFDVLFEGYPHPSFVVGDPSWITHRSMVVLLEDDSEIDHSCDFVSIQKCERVQS